MRLPLTLAIMDGMSVAVGDETYILPLASVIESIKLDHGRIRSIAGANRVIEVRQDFLPVVALDEVFQVPRFEETSRAGIMIVVEAEGARVALLVDELLGQHQASLRMTRSRGHRQELLRSAGFLCPAPAQDRGGPRKLRIGLSPRPPSMRLRDPHGQQPALISRIDVASLGAISQRLQHHTHGLHRVEQAAFVGHAAWGQQTQLLLDHHDLRRVIAVDQALDFGLDRSTLAFLGFAVRRMIIVRGVCQSRPAQQRAAQCQRQAPTQRPGVDHLRPGKTKTCPRLLVASGTGAMGGGGASRAMPAGGGGNNAAPSGTAGAPPDPACWLSPAL